MEGVIRTFSVSQIKAHFIGEPYSDCPEFIGQLVQHKILIKVAVNQYTYDLSKLNADVIFEIVQQIKYKNLKP